jgi:hypothetical protein
MTLTVTQWNQLKDETRNAAVDIHYARKAFLASAPEIVNGKAATPETVTHAENRRKLNAARDAYTEKVMQIQEAIVDDLDISRVTGELLMPEHEELLVAPTEAPPVETVQPGPGTDTTPAPTSETTTPSA